MKYGNVQATRLSDERTAFRYCLGGDVQIGETLYSITLPGELFVNVENGVQYITSARIQYYGDLFLKWIISHIYLDSDSIPCLAMSKWWLARLLLGGILVLGDEVNTNLPDPLREAKLVLRMYEEDRIPNPIEGMVLVFRKVFCRVLREDGAHENLLLTVIVPVKASDEYLVSMNNKFSPLLLRTK